MEINFFLIDIKTTLRERPRLKLFIASIFPKEGKVLNSINYIFCSDDYLLNINRQYLQHDYYTDIITFDLSDSKERIDAEVYISIDRVKENAVIAGQSFKHELHRVIFHGALHLCGYKDKSKPDITKMRKGEEKYLKMYFS